MTIFPCRSANPYLTRSYASRIAALSRRFGASGGPPKAPGNRPTLPHVAPEGAETWFGIDHGAFLRHSGALSVVLQGLQQPYAHRLSCRAEQRGGFWATCCSPTFRATDHSLTSRCRASNMS